jgi:hypothetical protein
MFPKSPGGIRGDDAGRHLSLATVVVMMAFLHGAYADLYVINQGSNGVLRFNEVTGDLIDSFISSSNNGGLSTPRAVLFGRDGNLYVTSNDTQSVMRYDGTTGAPLPAPGQTGATFIHPGSGGLQNPAQLIFGRDGNLYVDSQTNNAVLRYDGTTGAFIDAFISSGSGGLNTPLYLFFTHTDPTTLAYVPPPQSRFLITAASTAVSGTPIDITLTALDPSGNIDTIYQGTVTFSTTDPDPGVVLPADYTFTIGDGGDNGMHTFPGGVTLITVGDQALIVTDKVSGITGSATVTVGPGP